MRLHCIVAPSLLLLDKGSAWLQRLAADGQLKDVYTGGRHEGAIAAAIERALTQRDEFGNVMTPKERFRSLCHG